jgi:hypothetical protein
VRRQRDGLRWAAVALLVVAAVLSALGNTHHDRPLQAVAFGFFLAAAFVFVGWRRAQRAARGTVFDRETKTSDETRPRSDQ